MSERPKVTARELVDFLLAKTNDPVDQLCAVCEIAAELIKVAGNPENARAHFVEYLDGFLQLPSRYLAPDMDTPLVKQ